MNILKGCVQGETGTPEAHWCRLIGGWKSNGMNGIQQLWWKPLDNDVEGWLAVLVVAR